MPGIGSGKHLANGAIRRDADRYCTGMAIGTASAAYNFAYGKKGCAERRRGIFIPAVRARSGEPTGSAAPPLAAG